MKTRSVFQSVGELDQLRETARGASLEITQLKPGRMHGVLAHADLGLSSIHLNRFSLPARGRGSVSADRWTFVVFPLGISGQFNSQVLNSEEMLIYPPGGEFEGTISRSFQDWIFTVGYDELARASGSISQRGPANLPRSFACVSPDPKHVARLRSFASNAMASIEESPGLLADNQIRQALHAQLLEALSQAVLSATTEQEPRQQMHKSHDRIVRQSEGFIQANLDSPMSLVELCSLTGVSERTLRTAFLNVVGLSPHAYLKVIRLNRVRAELERSSRVPLPGATPVATTVAAAATRCGFFHLGRFSRDYRRFFGELPSETLRQ